MVLWILVTVAAVLLLIMTLRERFVDVPGPGIRPSMQDGSWRSKVDAQIRVGDSTEDYMKIIQKFYDEIYLPLRTKNASASPKDTDVEVFINANVPENMSKNAVRQIILSGFSVDRTESAAAREERQVQFKPSGALEPRDGVDQVYGRRREAVYRPANPESSQLFSEGPYAPTAQTEPRDPMDSSTPFASVCPCAQNIL